MILQQIGAGIASVLIAIAGVFSTPVVEYPQYDTLEQKVQNNTQTFQEASGIIRSIAERIAELKEQINEYEEVQEDSKFGSTNFVAGGIYRLAGSGIGLTDTTIELQSFTQSVSETELVMADFGSVGYITLEPGKSKKEFISFTGISQSSTTTRATLTGVTRGLSFISPYTAVSALRQTHSGGAKVIVSNPPQLYNRMAVKDNAEDIDGQWTFSSTSIPTLDAYLAPTDDADLASKKYIDDISIAGASDASFTAKGIVEIAKKTDFGASASSSDTSAFLVVPTSFFLASSTATTTAIVTNSDGKIDGGFINKTEAWGFVATTSVKVLDVEQIKISSTTLSSTAAELNKLDGASANVTPTNLNSLTDGTANTLHKHGMATGQTSTTTAGTLRIAHGLGATPSMIEITAVAKDSGGDLAMCTGTAIGTGDETSTCWAVDTAAGVRVQQQSTYIFYLEENDGVDMWRGDLTVLDATDIGITLVETGDAGTLSIQWIAWF